MKDKLPNRHIRQKLYGHHKIGGHPGGRKLPSPFRRLIRRANIVRCQELIGGRGKRGSVRTVGNNHVEWYVRLRMIYHSLQSSRY